MKPNNNKWIILGIVGGIVGALFGSTVLRSLSGGMVFVLFAMFFVGMAAVVVWSLSGNKIGKPASAEATADARAMRPAPGMARIYVVRRGFMGGMAGMKVDIHGIAAGQIRMNQFVMAEVPPGAYTVETAMARNGAKPSNHDSRIGVAAGDVVVLRAGLQLEAMHAVTTHERILGAEAQSELANAKMVQWTQ